MSAEQWEEVDRYIEQALIGPDAALDAATHDANAAGLPQIAVSPAQGKLLFILARAVGARRILELGTLGGYSAIWLARALPPGGVLVTIEAEPKHAEVSRRNFERAGVAGSIDLRLGKALEILPQLEAERRGPFDLVFIDADKISYPLYLDWSIKLGRAGTLIIADNVVRDGHVVDAASDDPSVVGVRRMHELIRSDQRVTATAIQTVGVKGYDGFAAILVR